MAYTALNLGYTPAAGKEYTATTDSSADWVAVPNNTTFFDLTDKKVYRKDDTGYIYAAADSIGDSISVYNHASTQWGATVPASVTLPDGNTANGFTFFTEANKDSDGTTSYDEYFLHHSFTITVVGGTAGDVLTVVIDGVNYTEPFDTDQFTTADNWVTTHFAALRALTPRITPHALGSGADGRIRICTVFSNAAVLDAITASGTGTLAPTVGSEFNLTNPAVSIADHIMIPKDLGKPYRDLRLHHTIRVNFSLVGSGITRFTGLSLRRMQNDTTVGSEIRVETNNTVQGNQYVFETYTNSLTDPFVTGGFYFALRNDSGASVDIAAASVGILIQTTYQSPVSFT